MIINIIILSLITWGIAQVFDEGMILGSVGAWIRQLPDWCQLILKPVIGCPPCMSSIWGTAAAIYLGYGLVQWGTLVLATAGLNYIIANK